jgi:hypothetical protein
MMAEAQSHNAEWQQLKSFLNQVDYVAQFFDEKKKPASPTPEAPSADAKPKRPALKNARGVVMTADLAEYVLKVHGPRLHLNKIIEFMREEGWEGSGDAHRDYKSTYQNLNDKKKRFRNVGENIWELVTGGRE